MPETATANPQADAERLESAADEAIAACGGDARALRAPMIANEFLEGEFESIVSIGYLRGYKHGRFRTYSG